ncbi:22356_t:CDS:2, partial [Racocetra persica]
MPFQAKETDKLLAKRQQSLKVISSNYAPLMDKDKVFGEELCSIIEKENSTNKLFNKTAETINDKIIEVAVVNSLTLE